MKNVCRYVPHWTRKARHLSFAVLMAAGALTGAIRASAQDASTLVLIPEDTYLGLDAKNYSESQALLASTSMDGKVASAIVMKFDLSSLPSTAVIQQATLNLAVIQSDNANDTYAIGVHKIVGTNPVVARATGASADGAARWMQPLAQGDISAPYDVQALSTAPGFNAWNVTSLAREWVADPSTNFGMLLDADTLQPGNRFRSFASMEHPDEGLHPFLRVTYSIDGGAPQSAAVTIRTTNTGPGVGAASTTSAGAASNDTEAPSVSLAAPSPRTPVTGTITMKAHVSDNVGVTAVQFKLDGINIGPEGTMPSYASSWDSSTTSNGGHSLTVVARDAAGNTRTSTPVMVTVLNSSQTVGGRPSSSGNGGGGSPTGNGGGTGTTGGAVLINSSWDTATGTSKNAVTDGGRWPDYWEFNHNDGTQLLSVVSGGPGGHNALRVQQRSSSYAANVQYTDVLPKSKDYYLRFYMRNDDTSPSGDHIVTVDTWKYANLTFMRKMAHGNDWNFVASLYGCGYTYPVGHWGPTETLAFGKWYRFEYFVHFVDATHIQLHPRVYDDKGTLLFSDAEFKQTSPGEATWNGRSDWSLASYYAAGNSFCVDPDAVNDIGLGNNGQQGASDTGKYWYFAGLMVRTDTWAGPMSGTSEQAPAPAFTPMGGSPASAPGPAAPAKRPSPRIRGGGGSLPPADVEGVSQKTQQSRPSENVPDDAARGPRGGKTH